MEIFPSDSWVALIPIIAVVVFAAWKALQKYRTGQTTLNDAVETATQKRIEAATKLSRERAEDYQALYHSEETRRKFAEDALEIKRQTLEELKIRLVARGDEIERLEEKCERVTKFNLTLQAQIEKLAKGMEALNE